MLHLLITFLFLAIPSVSHAASVDLETIGSFGGEDSFVSPDGKWILYPRSSWSKEIVIEDWENGQTRSFEIPYEGISVDGLSYFMTDPGGSRVALLPRSADFELKVLLVDLKGVEQPVAIKQKKDCSYPQCVNRIVAKYAAWSPNGSLVAAGGYSRGRLLGVWNTKNGRLKKEIELKRAVTRFEFSRDGKRLITWYPSTGAWVDIYDVESGKLIFELGHTQAVRDVEISANGNSIAVTQSSGYVWVWNSQTGERVTRWLEGSWNHPKVLGEVGISPNGDRVAYLFWYGGMVIRDTKTGNVIYSNSSIRDAEVSWTADSRYLYVGHARRTFFEVKSGSF